MASKRESDQDSEMTARLVEIAKERNLQVIKIIYDEDGSQIGDLTGNSFIALCPTVPRSGESIVLENGMRCLIRSIFYKTARIRDEQGKNEATMLLANVVAVTS